MKLLTIATLFIAQGLLMLRAEDEFRQVTQPNVVCPMKYSTYMKNSTACLPPSSNLLQAQEASPTAEVTNRHNYWRDHVVPRAADMEIMYWDSEVAAMALAWARSCPGNTRDQLDTSRIPDRFGLGQNVYVSSTYLSWTDVVDAWNAESKLFVYGQGAQYLGDFIDDYTQMVWHNSVKIGCAMAECSSIWRYQYFCYYGPRGNVLGQGYPGTPYTAVSLSRQSLCPSGINQSLCDCSGTACLTPDPNNPNYKSITGGQIELPSCRCITGVADTSSASSSLQCYTKDGQVTSCTSTQMCYNDLGTQDRGCTDTTLCARGRSCCGFSFCNYPTSVASKAASSLLLAALAVTVAKKLC